MKLNRMVGVAAASVALTLVGTALPSYAGEPPPLSAKGSAEALSSQGELKAETVAPDASELAISEESSEAVVLSPQSKDKISIGLPDAGNREAAKTVDDLKIYRSESDDTSVVVNPTETGVQLATVIGSANSPASYTYPIDGPAGSDVILDDEGGASVLDQNGNPLASIDAPWARDAEGKQVPTSFVLTGPNELTQVVEHTSGDFAYPITADPKIFRCDAYTSTCVKFTKSETKSIATGIAGKSAAAGALYLCSKIPNLFAGAACVVAVTAFSLSLGKSFKSAAKAGKCIELHFLTVPAPQLTRWKTESC